MRDISPDVKFKQLFSGGDRGHGERTVSGRCVTNEGPATDDNFHDHLEGITGLGVVPIMSDNRCCFAAIDIDRAEGAAEKGGVDVFAIEKTIRDHALPLFVCQSKSGGAHVYAFFKEPQPCGAVRKNLANIARLLGYPSAEIFPKQSVLSDGQIGNWINLPYFARGERLCIWKGEPIDFESFVEKAYAVRDYVDAQRFSMNFAGGAVSGPAQATKSAGIPDIGGSTPIMRGSGSGWKDIPDDYHESCNWNHEEAPPCLQALFSPGVTVPAGSRNEILAFIVIYLKRSNPRNYRILAREWAKAHLEGTVSDNEIETTIRSAGRRDYSPRCGCCSMIKSMCDSAVCKERVFGISGWDIDPSDAVVIAERLFNEKLSIAETQPLPYRPEYLDDYTVQSARMPKDDFSGESARRDDANDINYQDFDAIPPDKKFVISHTRMSKSTGKEEITTFGPLIQHKSGDDRQSTWTLFVNGKPIWGTTSMLFNIGKIKLKCAEYFFTFPVMKGSQWETYLKALFEHPIVIEAPEATTKKGSIRRHMANFADSAREGAQESACGAYGDIVTLRDHGPIVQIYQEKTCVMFRIIDFLRYLKSNSELALSMSELWEILEKISAKMVRVEVNGFEEDLVCVPDSFLPKRGTYYTTGDLENDEDAVYNY